METFETIGKRIRRLRMVAGLNKNQLAAAVKVDRTAIYHWEIDECAPNLYGAIELAKVLRVTLDYLAGLSQEGGPR